MGFQVSPGVAWSEIDLTAIVPATSTTEGAIAGVFRWGKTDERTLISNEAELVQRFGKPYTGFNVETFYVAADFLSYGDALWVTRVSDGNTAIADAANSAAGLVAAYPGELGNSLKVLIVGKTPYATTNTGIEDITDRAPTETTQVHLAVLDADGSFTGTADTVLEVWTDVDTVSGATTEDGTNNYLVDVLNTRSRYVNITEGTDISGWTALDWSETLAGGTDGSSENDIAVATLQAGYDEYDSADNVDVSLILGGVSRGATLSTYLIDNIAEVRKDCVVFISPEKADVVDNAGSEASAVIAFRNSISSSSYAVMDSGYKYRYDKYNDKYVWTPLNGDVAGCCVRTDDTRDPWWSPAGYQRGRIKNVVKLAWNPNKANRDLLYKADVNPVVLESGQGTVLFGDKTLLGRPSAFDRINVRRLFIVLEKAISRAAKNMLFEFNDEFTRAQFINLVEPFLRDVQGRRGIYDFRVVCDETNNTAEVIDRNEFVGDIYVKPARSINFIQLNFVAVRTGVEFEEIVGRF